MQNPRKTPKLSLPPTRTSLLLFTSFFVFAISTQARAQAHAQAHSEHHRVAVSTCQGTLYPDLCVSTVASFPGLAAKSLPQIISATAAHTAAEARASSANCTLLERRAAMSDPAQKQALDDCLELLDDTIAELNDVVADLATKKSASKHYHDLETLLSGAMTNQYTCLDGFDGPTGKSLRRVIEGRIVTISNHVSNILAMLKKIKTTSSSSDPAKNTNGFPKWVSSRERKLLEADVNQTRYDLVVANDGSGNFTTVGDAVAAAPNNSDARFVIYIKAGVYVENVEVVRKKRNLMFLGDGIEKTVIKGSRNHVDGWTTFRSATVAVVGHGFMAKGITFENSAGPSKHQAVALRSGSDLSTFFRCSFVGYQDTLYAHSLRQFYRECDVYGTVDFVFGNAAAVLQNCNLYARRPNPHQHNIFTAQGRKDPNQNTGLSLLNCKLAAGSDLFPVRASFRTYLGRPWKEFSRTVVIDSFIDDLVHPAGWLEWNATFALDTLYYAEYSNHGPGSNTTARVTWPGFRVLNSSAEASLFTVEAFIQGTEWLNSTRVPYFAHLT